MTEASEITASRHDKVCDRTEWRTPRMILDPVECFCGGSIYLDPCASEDNWTKARRYYSGRLLKDGSVDPDDDGLKQSWITRPGQIIFVNPPYGDRVPDDPRRAGTKAWVQRVGGEARKDKSILLLITASNRAGTIYFQEAIGDGPLDAMCHIRRRVPFIDPHTGEPARNNTTGSILYGLNVSLCRFRRYFGHLGFVVGGTAWPPPSMTGDWRDKTTKEESEKIVKQYSSPGLEGAGDFS